jgi:hypothetical protein
MAIASVQQVMETTDSFDDGTMVPTFAGAVTVGNAVVVLTIPEQSGRTVTGISGAAASFTTIESIASNPPLFGHAAIATATTAAQTVTLDDTTEFGDDIVFINELSGCASPLDESGTSQTMTNGSSVTDHNCGTITPDGTDTVYFVVIGFSGDPGTISNGSGTDLADWTNVSTGLSTVKVYRRIVNSSSAAVTFRITTSNARQSNGIFFALNGAAAGGSTTLSPAQAALTLNGRTGTINSFSAVFIREVLINEAGSPVTNRTGMSLLVWYAGNPVGAPDLSYSALTTDANGTASWSLPTGGLTFNQAIFYVATDGHSSLSEYTCARITPTYN